MAISGLHIAFAALLAAGLIRGGQFFAGQMDSLADAIAGRHSLRDMLRSGCRLTTACAAHGGGITERLGSD